MSMSAIVMKACRHQLESDQLLPTKSMHHVNSGAAIESMELMGDGIFIEGNLAQPYGQDKTRSKSTYPLPAYNYRVTVTQ